VEEAYEYCPAVIELDTPVAALAVVEASVEVERPSLITDTPVLTVDGTVAVTRAPTDIGRDDETDKDPTEDADDGAAVEMRGAPGDGNGSVELTATDRLPSLQADTVLFPTACVLDVDTAVVEAGKVLTRPDSVACPADMVDTGA